MKSAFFWAALLIFSSSLCPNAYSQEKLIWYHADFPPYVILDGEFKGQGVQDKIARYLIEKLPEYKHVFRKANYSRIICELRKGSKGLVVGLFKTPEREDYIHYSKIPAYIVIPNTIVIHKKNIDKFKSYFTEEKSIDIEPLILSKKFKLGISKGRSYSGVIDEMIRKHGDAFTQMATPDLFEKLLTLLISGRLDCVFGFPVEAMFVAEKLKMKSEIAIVPVSGMERYTPVYIGTPKNDWGKTVMAKIDKILNDEKAISEFFSYYTYWLDDSTINLYEQYTYEYSSKLKESR